MSESGSTQPSTPTPITLIQPIRLKVPKSALKRNPPRIILRPNPPPVIILAPKEEVKTSDEWNVPDVEW